MSYISQETKYNSNRGIHEKNHKSSLQTRKPNHVHAAHARTIQNLKRYDDQTKGKCSSN